MRNFYAFVLAAFCASTSLAGNGSLRHSLGEVKLDPKAIYVPGHMIIKLQEGQPIAVLKNIEAALQATNAVRIYPRHIAPSQEETRLGFVDLSRMYELTFSAPYRMEVALAMARKTKGVEYAEPRYIRMTTYVVNDSRRANQTYLGRVKANEAWDIHKGDTNTVVGIVDSGVDWDHPDMVGNIAYNYADPIDGVDNDNDGYIDNYRGWDLGGANFNNVVGDNNPAMTGANNNHGSHVAGISSATTDNRLGVAGSGFKCRVLPIKCAADNDTRGPGGVGFIIEGYEGITYGADHGCSVINCSWGGAGLSSYENDIVNYATINKNALVVCAAGNSSSGGDFFPACFNNVLNVAATNSTNDDRAGFTNYNSRVCVSAPGVNIFATIYNDSYGNLSGTSMAAPLVAGAAALLRSYVPALTPAQVIAQIRVTSDDIYGRAANSTPTYAGKLGKGRLNMFRMLTERTPGLVLKNYRITDGNDNIFNDGDTIRIKASYLNRLFPSSTGLTASFSTSSTFLTIDPATTVLNLGALGTGDSTSLSTATEVKIVVSSGAPIDANERIRIDFDDGTYSDFAMLEIDLNSSYVSFSQNNIASTIASNGRLGYAGESQLKGLGVALKGWGSLIYELGQFTAYQRSGGVNLGSSVRGATGTVNNDYTPTEYAKPADTTVAPYEYAGHYGNAVLGVDFKHRSYVWEGGADTGFYIHEYFMQNTSGSQIPNIFSGFYADPDVSRGGVNDIVAWDSATHMGYVKSTDSAFSVNGGPYFGIVLLTNNQTRNFSGLVNDGTSGPFNVYDGFSDAEHLQSLNRGVVSQTLPPIGRKDVSLSAGYGPINLSGTEVRLGYAMCVGYTLDALKKAAVRADSAYARILSTGLISSSNQTLTNSYLNVQLTPNPAAQFVRLSMPANATITVLNLRGQRVDLPLVKAGIQTELDIRTLPSGMYMVNIQTSQGRAVRRFVKQ